MQLIPGKVPSMSAPVVDSASFDKTSYQAGEKMTLTVTYHDPDTRTDTLTIVAKDQAGNSSAPITVNAPIVDPVTLAITSSLGKTYTAVSNDGKTAIFTATA